jgi:hypothetical protein
LSRAFEKMFAGIVFPTQEPFLGTPKVTQEIDKLRIPIMGEKKFLSNLRV